MNLLEFLTLIDNHCKKKSKKELELFIHELAKVLPKEELYNELDESDENFAYIAGYTSNGFPYGITWDEYNKMEEENEEETIVVINNDDELPF